MNELLHLKKILPKKRDKSSSWFTEKRILRSNKNLLAIDEAGRGALAGPLVIGGVYFTLAKIKALERDGVKFFDSKMISPYERSYFLKLIRKYGLKFKAVSVNSTTIDRVGINTAFSLGIEKLIDLFSPQIVVIDGLPTKINNKKSVRVKFFIKGDRRLSSIASASIVAKVYRDQHMIKISKKYPEYELENNKGYGTIYHRLVIQKLGLTKIHRQTFVGKFFS
ncbi:MAG: ribonuclease HII [Patescibacteria group bacterium]|nr:ribonuclease HII [Patescibacteria group bacterium]